MDPCCEPSLAGRDIWTSAAKAVQLVSGRWTLTILARLAGGGRRYQDLDEALGRVSHKVLTETLRRAECDGLVIRHLDHGRVETSTLYELTDLGRSLAEPLVALERWVDHNWSQVEAARKEWSRRSD